jgi:hypothetical protein
MQTENCKIKNAKLARKKAFVSHRARRERREENE